MLEENILIKKKDRKKKNLSILGILLVSIMLIGSVYAFFQYTRIGEEQSKLLAGEVYLHYSDGGNILHTKPNAFPETPTEARGTEDNPRTDNVINFTIDGKNTTTNKDIYYEIKLLYADAVTGRTRINDSDLRFDLEETINGVTKRVLENVSYDTINNTRIWVNTVKHGEEIEISYKLRMWIADDVIISDTDSNKTYTTEQYKNLFGSVKVMIYGDFEEKMLPGFYTDLETSLANYLLPDDGDARIVSGSKDDENLKNYVWYSGKLWRIVALNNDGSIKLITEDNITTINWGTNSTYSESYMYQWLNEDFLDTLYNYENIIVTDYEWDITQRDNEDATKPTKPNLLESTVGLLTFYEYVASCENASFGNGYLNNGYWWYLLTDTGSETIKLVTDSGGTYDDLSFFGVRPSIIISSDIKTRGNGDGSKSNPYLLEGDIADPVTNITKLNERVSGEYLKFDNELYRIVNIENGITKITKVDYIRNENTVVTKHLASTINFGAAENTKTDDYWDYYLNNTWYNNINTNTIDYKSMLVDGAWYLESYGTYDKQNYKNTICADVNTSETITECTKTDNIYNGKIGLGRVGEMFTTQLTNDSDDTINMWIITPYEASLVIYLNTTNCYIYSDDPSSNVYAVRPSMFLSSDVIITDGLGTVDKPFEIALP